MEGGALLENVPLTFDRPSQTMPVRVNFKPKNKGLRAYTFVLKSTAEADEEIRQNNAQSRVILVEDRKAKILYLEGEPRWDYKFIRRALTDDPAIEMHGLLRTSANKFYRQGMETENVLESGFPKQEELNGYDGVIIGSVEAGFFSAEDAQNLYDYVSRRGGGLLLFGARQSLADGGWQNTNLADLVPVLLNSPAHPSFIRNEAKAALTAYGVDAPMLQLGADAAKTSAAWKSLPPARRLHTRRRGQAGRVVLATLTPEGERSAYPFIVTQRFGRGRTMLFNSGSSWRWKMERDHTDDTHPRLWRQIARWLIEDTPSNVDVSTDRVLYRDDRHVDLRVEVHNKKYQPVDDAAVTASVTAPDGSKKDVRLEWSSKESGVYTGSYEASVPGIFSVEAKAGDYGEGTTFFERTTGTLEYSTPSRIARCWRAWRPIREASIIQSTTPRRWATTWSIRRAESPSVASTSYGASPRFSLLLLMLKGAEWGLRKYWVRYDDARSPLSIFRRCGRRAVGQTYAVVVAGIGGEKEFDVQFTELAGRIQAGLRKSGMAADHITLMTGEHARKEDLVRTFDDLAKKTHAADTVIFFMIGHASYDGHDYKFNIAGPDPTGMEMRDARQDSGLEAGGRRRHEFERRDHGGLEQAGTRGHHRDAQWHGAQRHGVHALIAEALEDPAADTDKNGSVSALEAFKYAEQKTAKFYETAGRIATEHPMLDDNGDGKGVKDPSPQNGEGILAATVPIVRFASASARVDTPEARELRTKKETLENDIAMLKYNKASLSGSEYQDRLEKLLLDLARTQQALEKLESTKP